MPVESSPSIEITKTPEASVEFSIVMPCLNEAETLSVCIQKAQRSLSENNVAGEIIIADNGSSDGSQEIAAGLGARVVHIAERGYGNALMGGITAARGEYIIMGDADDSYDFSTLGPFITKLRQGYDLVMGNRFRGGIAPGAMPALHRYLGNPVLTSIGRLFFHSPVGDFHCGLRGFSESAVTKLDLQTTGMEFASEMVVKATLRGMRIAEVPTTLSPDGRTCAPHLRSWRDGWRHLRFLLLYSPRWLFLYPGALLMLIGLMVMIWLVPGPKAIAGVRFDVHTLLYAAATIIIGFQSILFAVFTKIFAISEGLLREDSRLDRVFQYVTLEVGLLASFLLILAGLGGSVYAYWFWNQLSFGDLNPSQTMRIVIPAVTSLTLGCQTMFSSFFLSILGLRRR
jgi:glycosyltransferase involved in cell wall biosynthesis